MVRYQQVPNIYLVGGASSASASLLNVFSANKPVKCDSSAELPCGHQPLGIAMNADQGKSMDNQTLSQLLDRVIAGVLALDPSRRKCSRDGGDW